ncbi:amidohydrolase [Rathayibacter rathayi]|uniref:Amidohydrolase n=1 Tax=Rathayibacter rathayi TaxID=33887 RepID=A0ABD6WBJ6_RATRA|nr:amidohydrolase family protein [Rathayibacter rathayi]AZZ48870.1 amidohydrolase [Rathayibacter rathayi]MWV73963.1 amidohydrolase family protein [Rathayibacter rathayi NCPPB 2980 = VKM Ac-1601]PPF15349.1 amidohydrolase [Rathayibacter rathayi]PPF49529.1 amidohydrolase [Rathayibacter rathayi]PPG71434.1 amidohydrolase [Rathayibacter rathayi]
MSRGLLLRGARLLGSSRPCAVLLREGRLAAIGPEVVPARGDDVRDLDGRWLLPGLWDEHVHFSQWAMTAPRLDVSAAASARETADAVRQRLAEQPGAGTLIGFGFRDGLWPEPPTTALLDEVSPARPVVLISGDLHCAWLNSAAYRQYGVAAQRELVREDPCFELVTALGALGEDELDALVDTAAGRAAARGVVGVVDLEMGWNAGDWTRRVGRGTRSLRVETGVYRDDLDRALAEGLRSGDDLPGGEGLLRMGPLKVLIDGSLNTRTAYCAHPYADHDGYGVLTVEPAELDELLARAAAGGIRSTVHAIGDAAATLALDALGRVGGGRIEHAQLLADTDLPRFAALGVEAGVQPAHALDDREVAERYWPGRTGRAFPLRSLLDSGARVVLGSDAPVAPLDPWVAVSAAVFRALPGDEPWHPEQRMSVEEAIIASTRVRRLMPAIGDPADLVVVERDPLRCDCAELRSMPVAATLLGGRFTHGA